MTVLSRFVSFAQAVLRRIRVKESVADNRVPCLRKKKKKKNLSSLADSIGCSGSRHHGLPFASELIRAACLDDAQAERIEISKKVSNQLLLLVVDDKTRLPRD